MIPDQAVPAALLTIDADGHARIGFFFHTPPRPRPGTRSSTLCGLLDAIGTVLTVGLRNGVPLQNFADRLIELRFAPDGMTDDPELPEARSVTDYVFRRLTADYLRPDPST